MKTSPSVLLVSHNIFLTRDERYALINGEAIEVVGVSIPIWFSKKHTSAPAQEVFCKYSIYNNPNEPPGTVQVVTQGYRINLPQASPKRKRRSISDDQWMRMSEKELAFWYDKNATPPNANYLKDIEDGGAEYLKFKYLGEFEEKAKKLQLMHYCEIKTIELLKNTLV